MTARVTIAALLGLCLGLAALSYSLLRELNRRPTAVPAAVSTILTNRVVRLVTNPPAPDRVVVRKLDWSTIESEDYAEYIANLRRIGCPEETVRDIILADVRKLYARRRAAITPPPRDFEYWRAPEERSTAAEDREEAEALAAQLIALDREERALVQSLLGVSPEAIARGDLGPAPERLREVAFLPPERGLAVARALDALDERAREIEFAGGDPAAALAALDAQRRDTLAGLLTPAELLEYDLRHSPIAEELRLAFRGAGATREEFIALFQLRQQEEAALAAIPPDALDAAARREVIEAETTRALQALLPPQRLADFERARDPDFQVLYDLALDSRLEPAVATQVYDMRRTVAEQAARLENDPFLTAEQKRAGLAAMRRETERSIGEVLGAPLLELYRQRGGDWLEDLTAPGRIAADPLPETELATSPGVPGPGQP